MATHAPAMPRPAPLDPAASITGLTVGDQASFERYLALQDLVPTSRAIFAPAQLRELVTVARMTMRDREWERAFVILAYHGSQVACDLLREAEPHVPARLRDLFRLALADAFAHLDDTQAALHRATSAAAREVRAHWRPRKRRSRPSGGSGRRTSPRCSCSNRCPCCGEQLITRAIPPVPRRDGDLLDGVGGQPTATGARA